VNQISRHGAGPGPGEDPSETGPVSSPAYANSVPWNSDPIDPMVAVGNQYVVVSDTSNIAFFDKQKVQQLDKKNEMPTSVSTNEFFRGFISETNADGSFNESNINHYLGFPKPCDSTDYPQTINENRFCVDEFYDTRVFFDSTSKRFFVIAYARNQLWQYSGNGACMQYKDKPKSDTSACVNTTKLGQFCTLPSKDNCDLIRRYVVFAVSKTEDPRDGFYQ
jgi:hypothetical protein